MIMGLSEEADDSLVDPFFMEGLGVALVPASEASGSVRASHGGVENNRVWKMVSRHDWGFEFEYAGRLATHAVIIVLSTLRLSQAVGVATCVIYSRFSMPVLNCSPFLSLLVVTQIRGHIAGSSPPSPLRYDP